MRGCSNFFSISTQPTFDVNCLFREIYLLSDELQSFVGLWLTNTATGSTGFLLVLVAIPFTIYALPIVRRKLYRTFLMVHKIGAVLLFVLSFIHGGAALVQAPAFPHYIALPLFVVIVDYLLRVQNAYRRLRIVRVTRLASGVTRVDIEKPRDFRYNAGQYISLVLSPLGQFTS